MESKVREIGIFARNLSDGERLGELLFGLIMTLTFTLTAGFVVGDDQDAVRELLIATIGCNIAWGIIDGGLMIIGNAFRRGQLALLGETLRSSDRPEQATSLVAAELGDMVDPLIPAERRETFYREIANHVRNKAPERSGMRADDWIGAMVMFVMVVISSLPAALPFVFIDEPWIALRVSNGVLLAMLFLIGWRWAGYTTISRWRAGLTMFGFGGLLVAVAIALGG
ncbi:VIT1/CCC1 transporter family protein [Arenimonas daejeonensis]|uniref:VIT1/CCC1 transporter family protein n=1 Tax=Arenimonas daejeonensis TaxID=370777 RepID=UPI0011BE6F16|nr:VIT1/CCC1 transporter family protein [Arenimonas daejeonensis]